MKKYLLILCFLNFVNSNATIGDVVFETDIFGNASNFSFDQTSNQFILIGSSSVFLFNLSGDLIKQTPIVKENYFTDGMAVVDADSIIGISDSNQITFWDIGLNNSNEEEFLLQNTVDLSAYNVSSFNRVSDGSFWFLHNTITETKIIHMASNFTEISSVEYPTLSISGEPIQSGKLMTVEPNTGNLLLTWFGEYMDPGTVVINDIYTEFSTYYIDPNDMSVLGRFELDRFRIIPSVTNGVMYTYKTDTGEIKGYELSEADKPSVTSMVADIEGYIWNRCGHFNNDAYFNATVNWGAGADSGYLFEGDAGFDIFIDDIIGTSASFNVEYDISGSTEMAPDSIMVELINTAGQTSGIIPAPIDMQISYAMGFNSFCQNYGYSEEATLGGRQTAKWTTASSFPFQPIEATIDFDESFPFLGGKSFGVKNLQLAYEAAILSKGLDKATMSGGGTFKAGIGEVDIKAGLGLTTELTQDEILYENGLFNFQITGKLKEEQPILELIPALAVLAETPFVGRALKMITKMVKGIAEISLTSDSTLTVVVPDGLISEACIEGKQELAIGLKVGIVAELMQGVAELSVFGGSNAKVSWQTQPNQCPSIAFNSFVMQLYLTAKYVLYGASSTFEQVYSINYPFPTNKEENNSQLLQQKWQYTYPGIERTNKSSIQPVLENLNPLMKIKALSKLTQSATNQMPIVSGIGKDAKPSALIAEDGTAMLLWMQERSDLPATQATDIYYSYFNGTSFSTPAPIATDTNADFNPKIAYHKSGKWVAVWTHVRDDNLLPTGDPQNDAVAQTMLLDPVYSVFNPATLSWNGKIDVPNKNIKTDESASYMLSFATGPQKELALIWVFSRNGGMIPPYGGSSYTTITWSTFLNGAFESAVELNNSINVNQIKSLSGIYDGQQLVIARTLADNQFNPDPNQDLDKYSIIRIPDPYDNNYTTSPFFDGAGVKLRMMEDGRYALIGIHNNVTGQAGVVLNRNVFVKYGSTWEINDEEILLYQNFDTCCSKDFMHNLQFSETNDGKIYAVIPELKNGNTDFVVAIEDENAISTSFKGLLEGQPNIEKYMTTALDPNGDLVLFYYQSNLLIDQVMVDVGNGPEEMTRTREADSGMIMMAVHEINTDLSIDNVNHTVGLSETGHKAKVFATVLNSGNIAIQNPKVSFFARDITESTNGRSKFPDVPIVENYLAFDGWFAAGAKAEINLDWTIPEDAEYQVYVIVDPDNEIDEFDEQNNQGEGTPADLIFLNGFE